MFPNNVEYYPILDESIPEIPNRSRFYHLQPLGIGTPISECLTSYISRLALAHSVSLGNFFEFALVTELKKNYLKALPNVGPASQLASGGFQYRIKNINSLGETARDWVNVLQKLTFRNDLSSLTFLKLSNVLSRYHNTYKSQAWCPFCLGTMKENNSQIYYPLLWSMADVKICHIHKTPIFETCPGCSKTFYSLSRRVNPGFCSRCQIWLGKPVNQISQLLIQTSEEEFEWNLFVSREVSELIAFISADKAEHLSIPLYQTIKLCVENATNDNKLGFSRLIQVKERTFSGWYYGRVKPHLKDILKICYCLNLKLLEFLTQPNSVIIKPLKLKQFPPFENKPPRARPRVFEPEKVKAEIEKYLDIHPPLSMAEISIRVGYDRQMLTKAFPEINKIVKLKYYKYRDVISKERRGKLEKEIKFAIRKLEKRGEFVSARRVAIFLNKPSYTNRREVAEIIFTYRKSGKPKSW